MLIRRKARARKEVRETFVRHRRALVCCLSCVWHVHSVAGDRTWQVPTQLVAVVIAGNRVWLQCTREFGQATRGEGYFQPFARTQIERSCSAMTLPSLSLSCITRVAPHCVNTLMISLSRSPLHTDHGISDTTRAADGRLWNVDHAASGNHRRPRRRVRTRSRRAPGWCRTRYHGQAARRVGTPLPNRQP